MSAEHLSPVPGPTDLRDLLAAARAAVAEATSPEPDPQPDPDDEFRRWAQHAVNELPVLTGAWLTAAQEPILRSIGEQATGWVQMPVVYAAVAPHLGERERLDALDGLRGAATTVRAIPSALGDGTVLHTVARLVCGRHVIAHVHASAPVSPVDAAEVS